MRGEGKKNKTGITPDIYLIYKNVLMVIEWAACKQQILILSVCSIQLYYQQDVDKFTLHCTLNMIDTTAASAVTNLQTEMHFSGDLQEF